MFAKLMIFAISCPETAVKSKQSGAKAVIARAIPPLSTLPAQEALEQFSSLVHWRICENKVLQIRASA